MMIAGALAGVAGSIEIMGIHYRLIEGFSLDSDSAPLPWLFWRLQTLLPCCQRACSSAS
jgi:hypothetical protein